MTKIAEQPTTPIDPVSSYRDRPLLMGVEPKTVYIYDQDDDTPLTAYEDLGGRLPKYTIDVIPVKPPKLEEPERFAKLAEIYQADTRKVEIARGLGGLGLSVMTPNSFKSMGQQARQDFSLAVRMYGEVIKSRSRVLATPGSVDGFNYGEVTDEWAQQYAQELSLMRQALKESDLYRPMIETTPRVQRARQLASLSWELHKRKDGIYVVYKPSARRSRAA